MKNSKVTKRARKRNVLIPVLERIWELIPKRTSARAIRKQLEEDVNEGSAKFKLNDIPSLRTVQNIVADLKPPKTSDPWSLADVGTDEAALVMPVWREVVDYTQGEVSYLTKAEAKWIVRIRRVAPKLYPDGLSFWHIYLLAREYVLLTDRKKPTTGPDVFLAYAPWESLKAALLYEEAVRNRLIPARLILDLGTEEAVTTEEDTKVHEESMHEAHEGEEDTDGQASQ